jgi:hypothetical protein
MAAGCPQGAEVQVLAAVVAPAVFVHPSIVEHLLPIHACQRRAAHLLGETGDPATHHHRLGDNETDYKITHQ